jgi:2-polyprenyl-3-methyl-5-hydroxy-6-metoxy-1,4-benzoquinol methylase
MNPTVDLRDPEKIRQQFDYGPYPRKPLEVSPREEFEDLYVHNLVTPYYLRHRRVIDTQGKIILDAGCGSGYNALILAEANPGAKIVGIDLSEQSVNLARQRLQYHGFENAEFYQLALEDLPQLGLKFDYINCDEVLYILPDPVAGLQAMKSVLQPDGLIRTNLHNAYQRARFYQAQELFQLMGLMDNNPEDFEEEVVLETMKSLKDAVVLKRETWAGRNNESKDSDELKQLLAMNFLFVGDTGYRIPDLFNLLEQADLEFVSMVNWRQWDLTALFENPDELPMFWQMGLASADQADQLRMFELLHPVHRLMDFWCAHPGESGLPVDDWSEADWQMARVHLHPQLKTEVAKTQLVEAIRGSKAFDIGQFIAVPRLAPVLLEASVAAALLPLWDGPQPIQAIAQRYRQLRPVNPVTLEPISEAQAFAAVKDLLNRLDAFLYVLVER